MNMKFQVSDARNPLASVARITEHGNIVQFGPKEEDNYIFNPGTGVGRELHQEGVDFQRAGLGGPQQVPPASRGLGTKGRKRL